MQAFHSQPVCLSRIKHLKDFQKLFAYNDKSPNKVTESISNNKRIAKNTIILYMRTILLMLISLYTSRVVLQELGASDFGIYNIVGGVVVLFVFINNAISTQRFLTFELGRKDYVRLGKVFSMSLSLHLLIAVLIVLLGETVGLWFLKTQINIPTERMDVALVVYHLSVATCVFSVLRSPYTSTIIAYERMSFFGISSLFEGVLKLLVAFMLVLYNEDRLVLYAILMLAVTFFITLITKLYCNKHFECTSYKFTSDRVLAKQLISFSSWSLLGSASMVGINQGISIVFNIFFGVVVNTAMGIANQVNAAVYSFVSNFQTAFIPQIVKTYAANENEQFNLLLNRSARYSFLLLFCIGYPLFIECDYVLDIWLVSVPEYAVAFTQLIILNGVFDALSGPLWSAVQATGRIRNYQITISVLLLLSLPLSYVALRMGASAPTAFSIKVLASAIVLVYRVLYLKKHLRLQLSVFFRDVALKALLVVIFAVLGYLAIKMLSLHEFASIIVYAVYGMFLVLLVGLDKRERGMLASYARKLF